MIIDVLIEPADGRPQIVVERRLDAWDAAEQGDIQSVQALLEHGAARLFNTTGAWGRTPLHYCAITNNAEVAKLMLENGAKVMKRIQKF